MRNGRRHWPKAWVASSLQRTTIQGLPRNYGSSRRMLWGRHLRPRFRCVQPFLGCLNSFELITILPTRVVPPPPSFPSGVCSTFTATLLPLENGVKVDLMCVITLPECPRSNVKCIVFCGVGTKGLGRTQMVQCTVVCFPRPEMPDMQHHVPLRSCRAGCGLKTVHSNQRGRRPSAELLTYHSGSWNNQ